MRQLLALILSLFTLTACVDSIDKQLLTMDGEQQEEFIIANALVFDGFKFTEDSDVWVRDGKILAIGQDIEVALGTPIYDATGATLIPGLIDTHVHLFSAGAPPWKLTMGDISRTLSANLSAGITSVLDMGAPLGDIAGWENDTGQLLPRFAFAGTMFNIEGGHPAPMVDASAPWPLSIIFKKLLMTEVASSDDIIEAVDEHKAEGASFIKLAVDEIPLGTPKMEVDRISEIVHYAHKNGLKVAAHIGSEEDLLRGIAAGVDLFVHGPYRSTFSDEALVKLKSSGIPLIPTTVVFEQLARFYESDVGFSAIEIRLTDPAIKAAYQDRPEDLDLDEDIDAWFQALTKYRQTKFATVKRMHEAGIPIFMGSDSPNVFTFAGAALHREMALLERHAEMNPQQLLAAATGNPGRWLEQYLGWKVGRIKPGYDADMVLLNADLRQSITGTQDIARIWLGGQEVIPLTPENQP